MKICLYYRNLCFSKPILKIIIFIGLLWPNLFVVGQIFIGENVTEILESYELDSSYIEVNDSNLILQWDTLNSGTVTFKLKDKVCYEYTYELTCQKCYEVYVFDLFEDYYSDWFHYKDSIYLLKRGNIGWQLDIGFGKKKEYNVPRMSVRYDTLKRKCMTATVTSGYMDKETYNDIFKKPDLIKIKKRSLNGVWKIQPNSEYPTEIDRLEIDGKYAKIIFIDSITEEYELKWITKNTFQLWYFEEDTQEYEIYLTGEIKELSNTDLNLWFYDCFAKYNQSLKNIKIP